MVAAGHILEDINAAVQCPHCGTWFSPDGTAFYRRQRKMRLMNLPVVETLPPSTRAFWRSDDFMSFLVDSGEWGITQLSIIVPYSISRIHDHLQALVAANLLEPHYIGKKRRYKRYSLHRDIAA